MEVFNKRMRNNTNSYLNFPETNDADLSDYPKRIKMEAEEMDNEYEDNLELRLDNVPRRHIMRGSSSRQVDPEIICIPTTGSPVPRPPSNQRMTNNFPVSKPSINKISVYNPPNSRAVTGKPFIRAPSINRPANNQAPINRSPINKSSISTPPIQRQLSQQSRRSLESSISLEETLNTFPLTDVTNGVQKTNSNLSERRLPDDLTEIQRLQDQLRIREENVRTLSSENRSLLQKLEDMRGAVAQYRKELRNTKIELEYVQSLNKKWQECAINRCGMIATMFNDMNNKLKDKEVENFDAPIGHEQSGQIHLGRGVWLSKETYLLACSNIKHSTKKKFVRNILVSIFGYDILTSSTVTGKSSNRSKKDMKPEPLDPAKLLAVKDIYRHFLMTNLKMNCHDAEIEADQTNRYITKKIAQIKGNERRPKPGKDVMNLGGREENSEIRFSQDSQEAGSSRQIENHSASYSHLDLERDEYSETEDHQFREYSLGSEDPVLIEDSLDTEDSDLVENSHFVKDPLETKNFQYTDNFLQAEGSHFAEGPPETKDSIKSPCVGDYNNANSHFVDVSNVFKELRSIQKWSLGIKKCGGIIQNSFCEEPYCK